MSFCFLSEDGRRNQRNVFANINVLLDLATNELPRNIVEIVNWIGIDIECMRVFGRFDTGRKKRFVDDVGDRNNDQQQRCDPNANASKAK